MIEVLGLAGIILFLAGLHVLWQSREELLYWLGKFLETFRSSLRATGGLAGGPERVERANTSSGIEDHEPVERADALRRRPSGPTTGQIHVMRMMSALGLLLLGPLLVLLSLFLSL